MICRFVLNSPIGEFNSAELEYRNKAAVIKDLKRLGSLESWVNRIEYIDELGKWEML